jgi:hypothetical protein
MHNQFDIPHFFATGTFGGKFALVILITGVSDGHHGPANRRLATYVVRGGLCRILKVRSWKP